MSLRIAGMGWVTPLGSGVSAVWERLLNGERATPQVLSSTVSSRTYPAFRVPAEACADAPAHPRLRRSSAISRFAAAAGLGALKDADLTLDAEAAARTAIIFAISNGGVIYTKRFYHEVVESGAQAASPLLFPETVFNAPASHLAAILGITGASYTLVGDGAVGVLAMKMAEDLMANPSLDRCLIVGAEEADWLLCDAYSRWRLLRAEPPIEIFEQHPGGTIVSEGAGAVLFDRDGGGAIAGSVRVEQIDAGGNFARQTDAARCLDQVFNRLNARDADLIVASANGTFVDTAERATVLSQCPTAAVYAPKAALGESVGAVSLWQIISGAQVLRTQRVPDAVRLTPEASMSLPADNEQAFTRAVISACGLNQQVAGLSLLI